MTDQGGDGQPSDLAWIEQSGNATALIDPGKPWQNGSNESFNGKLRDEFALVVGGAGFEPATPAV